MIAVAIKAEGGLDTLNRWSILRTLLQRYYRKSNSIRAALTSPSDGLGTENSYFIYIILYFYGKMVGFL